MALVDFEVAAIRGRLHLRHVLVAVALPLLLKRRRRRRRDRGSLPHRVQQHYRERADPLYRARRSGRLARLEHASRGQQHRGEIVKLASGARRARLDMLEVGADAVGIGERGDPSVADLARELERLGAVGRDVNRNRILEIDITVIGMEKADRALALALAVHHFLAAQQLAAHLDILAHPFELDRRQAHRIASGKAGADTQHRAARREQVDGRDRMGGDRLDAVGGNRHAGAELDSLRMLGGEREAYVDVAVDHLRIVKPGVTEAVILGYHQVFPGIRTGRVCDREFHRSALLAAAIGAAARAEVCPIPARRRCICQANFGARSALPPHEREGRRRR